MNIFKEMVLSVYSFKSYKEFLNNKRVKVVGFGIMLMLIYFAFTEAIPFAIKMIGADSLTREIRENMPDFELKNGVLQVDGEIEYMSGNNYVYIDTEQGFDANVMQEYLDWHLNAILMDSEKVIVKNNGQIKGIYFSDLKFDLNKKILLGLVPFIYAIMSLIMVFIYLWMTAFFFFGVLFVALIGMIVASCMKYQLTFGQLYLLGIYSRTLPLIIKAVVSFLPINIPFFFIINFGLSVFIIGAAIQKMKEQNLQDPITFTS